MSVIWLVKFSPDHVAFDTKETAERYARLMFPNEWIEERYARIYFVEVWTAKEIG